MQTLISIGLLYCLILILSFRTIVAQKPGITDIIKNNYDKHIRPLNNGSEAVYVTIGFLIRDIISIDITKMEYSVDLTIYQQWDDSRLRFSSSSDMEYFTLLDVDQVWKPDVYFMNQRAHHHGFITILNNAMKIYPNGTVHYSSRLSVTLSCPIDLKEYPFDEQNCSLILSTYGYTTKDVELVWKSDDKPVQTWQSKMDLRIYTMNEPETHIWYSIEDAETHTCLQINFTFTRKFIYYMMEVYIPCCMFVILSWTSFWLDRDAVTARILIGLSSLLVMVTQIAVMNRDIPAVSYTKAIDVWTGMCLTFAFAAFIEFIVVNYLERCINCRSNSQESKDAANSEMEIPLNSENEHEKPSVKNSRRATLKRFAKNYISQFKTLSQRIDGVSRFVFPTVFLLFVAVYFLTYC